MTDSPQTPAAPSSGLNFERVLPIFALTFVDVLGLTVILPLLHLYAVRFGATPLEIGLVAAAFPLAQLIGVPVMGALSDRYGRKPLLLISQVTTCISFVMLGMAGSLWMVILSRVIDGLFGANIATAQAALSDITTEENRAQGLGLTGAAFGLGFIFGPVIALLALEFSDDLAVPAYIAAAYSFLSILLTLFVFKETLPESKRGATGRGNILSNAYRMLLRPHIGLLLVLMFAQQVIFFGFESLLGLFTLNRLGLLGQGNAVIFVIVGVLLVGVQMGMIGKWTRRYGEARVAQAALAMLAVGLLLLAGTPQQPHPLYVQRVVQNELASMGVEDSTSSTEAMIGEISVELPRDEDRGFGGVLVTLLAIVPLSIGAGLIRPSLNSLMTRSVSPEDFGSVLGASSAFVSAANAVAPLMGGLLFQRYGALAPFAIGGVIMAVLWLVSMVTLPAAHRSK